MGTVQLITVMLLICFAARLDAAAWFRGANPQEGACASGMLLVASEGQSYLNGIYHKMADAINSKVAYQKDGSEIYIFWSIVLNNWIITNSADPSTTGGFGWLNQDTADPSVFTTPWDGIDVKCIVGLCPSDYQCAGGKMLKADTSAIACQALQCTDDECCDACPGNATDSVLVTPSGNGWFLVSGSNKKLQTYDFDGYVWSSKSDTLRIYFGVKTSGNVRIGIQGHVLSGSSKWKETFLKKIENSNCEKDHECDFRVWDVRSSLCWILLG